MGPEENGGVGVGGGSPLDLNNLPEDFTRDGKQASEDTCSSGTGGGGGGGQRRKKGREGKEESGNKVYECRFCSLKFCKSQALGGHMNRHRQERETESLNKARQLVFGAENLAPYGAPFPPHPHHLGGGGGGGYPHHHHQSAPLMYQAARMFPSGGGGSGSPTAPPPSGQLHHHQQQQPLLYPVGVSYPAPHHQYHHHHHHSSPNYFLDESSSNYTCIGAPVAGPHPAAPAGGFMLNSSGSSATTALHHLHHAHH